VFPTGPHAAVTVRRNGHLIIPSVGIMQESVLELEYIFAVEPPKPREKKAHDDWCVDPIFRL
jgi:hypothetical protein